jgi:hypothetical protein
VRVNPRVKTAFSGKTTRKTCRSAGYSAGQNGIFRQNNPQNMTHSGSFCGKLPCNLIHGTRDPEMTEEFLKSVEKRVKRLKGECFI